MSNHNEISQLMEWIAEAIFHSWHEVQNEYGMTLPPLAISLVAGRSRFAATSSTDDALLADDLREAAHAMLAAADAMDMPDSPADMNLEDGRDERA